MGRNFDYWIIANLFIYNFKYCDSVFMYGFRKSKVIYLIVMKSCHRYPRTFYIFVNLFLVFTTFGTASFVDTTKIAFDLARSLRDLSMFYVDLIILQGLGIFPFKLLWWGTYFAFSEFII